MRDSALKLGTAYFIPVTVFVGDELMRDSALKPSPALHFHVQAKVGDELMRDSALKRIDVSPDATNRDRSETSSCATAL